MTVTFIFQPGVIDAIRLTSAIHAVWSTMLASDDHYISWYYLTVADSVFRVFPGVQLRKTSQPKNNFR